jgi:hypothetical protein
LSQKQEEGICEIFAYTWKLAVEQARTRGSHNPTELFLLKTISPDAVKSQRKKMLNNRYLIPLPSLKKFFTVLFLFVIMLFGCYFIAPIAVGVRYMEQG